MGESNQLLFMVLSASFHPLEKANAIADCFQTLPEAVDNNSPERIRPCDLQKLVNSLKLRKACGIDGIPNECLRQLPRRPLVHLTHLINHCLGLSHFPTPWKDTKIITKPKPGTDSKFPQIYGRLASLVHDVQAI
jgi:hypothetical protein